MVKSVNPSMGYYIVGTILAVGGPFVSAALLIQGEREEYRMVAPGSGTYTLTETGPYSINYEYRGEVDGKEYVSPPELPLLTYEVRNAKGDAITVSPASTKIRYGDGNNAPSGMSVRLFSATAPGEYTLTITNSSGSPLPQYVIMVRRHGPLGILSVVLAMLLSSVLGFAILVVTFVKRRKVQSSS